MIRFVMRVVLVFGVWCLPLGVLCLALCEFELVGLCLAFGVWCLMCVVCCVSFGV